jgi:hypothetical protein
MLAPTPHALPKPCPALIVIHAHLAHLAAATLVAAEALEGCGTIDLCSASLETIAGELATLAGRVDLVLDRLAAALDPAAAVFGVDLAH